MKARENALTLVECLLASVLLAFCVVAVSQAVVAGQMQTCAALHHRRAVELAEAMMDEILRLPYDDPEGPSTPGPEPGELNRFLFDNADDYHGLTETADSLTDAAGAAYPATLQGFGVSANAAYGSVGVTGFADPLAALTVTVAVQDDSGRTWTVTRVIAQPPS